MVSTCLLNTLEDTGEDTEEEGLEETEEDEGFSKRRDSLSGTELRILSFLPLPFELEKAFANPPLFEVEKPLCW